MLILNQILAAQFCVHFVDIRQVWLKGSLTFRADWEKKMSWSHEMFELILEHNKLQNDWADKIRSTARVEFAIENLELIPLTESGRKSLKATLKAELANAKNIAEDARVRVLDAISRMRELAAREARSAAPV